MRLYKFVPLHKRLLSSQPVSHQSNCQRALRRKTSTVCNKHKINSNRKSPLPEIPMRVKLWLTSLQTIAIVFTNTLMISQIHVTT